VRTSRFASLAVLGLLTLIAAPAAVASGPSHASLWQNRAKTLDCGNEASAISKKFVLCSADGIPRPPHSSPNVGDPFVQLAATGKPVLILISQDTFATSKIQTLASGSTWSSRGVTCHVSGKTALCYNGDNHGFLIGNGHYQSF
jgi:hypothetical protein